MCRGDTQFISRVRLEHTSKCNILEYPGTKGTPQITYVKLSRMILMSFLIRKTQESLNMKKS